MAAAPAKDQQLILVTALGGLLLEELERLNDDEIASEELIASLRDTCERARAEIANVRAANG